MRFFALMPVRNEASRYLESNLLHHGWMFDGIAVYDDQSSDGSGIAAEKCGADVRRRPRTVPSFLEHEGVFRQASYDWLVEALRPTEDDWILALDADEFLVGAEESRQLIEAVQKATTGDLVSVNIPLPEVFFIDDDQKPFVRTDGFWPTLSQPRLFRYQTNGRYADKKMASGAVPTYATVNPSLENAGLSLLHYGYAHPRDRETKYDRYSQLPGHGSAHVESIRSFPTLVPWSGKIPLVVRGRRD